MNHPEHSWQNPGAPQAGFTGGSADTGNAG